MPSNNTELVCFLVVQRNQYSSSSVCPRQVIPFRSYCTVRVLYHTDWLSFGLGAHLLFIACWRYWLLCCFSYGYVSVTLSIFGLLLLEKHRGSQSNATALVPPKREGSEYSVFMLGFYLKPDVLVISLSLYCSQIRKNLPITVTYMFGSTTHSLIPSKCNFNCGTAK